MKKKLIISIVVCVLVGIPVFLFCAFVVWPPDIFTGTKHTIATLPLTNGDTFTVVQYWNHIDFYSTELHHHFSDGHVTMKTLDGDDAKSWSVPITVDEQRRVVTVTLSGHRQQMVSY